MSSLEPTAEPSRAGAMYGSDPNGLVWGYRFVQGEPAQQLDAAQVAAWLAAPQAGSFVWLHFSLTNASAEPWLRTHLELPDAFYDSLHEGVGSTRLEQEGDTLVAIVHDVLFDFNFDPSAVSTVSLALEPQVLVSARRRALRSVDRLRAALRAGQSFRSPVELLAQLLWEQAAVLVDIVRQSTTRVDAIEDRLLAGRVRASRGELGSLRRVLVRLQRLLAPEPAALFRLLSRPPAWIGEDDLQDLRQAAEEFSTAVADSLALVERVKLLQEELTAHLSEQANRTLFVLTVVTVLALPINLIAGLFGMNVGGVPLAENRHGFTLVAVGLVLLTGLLAWLAFGRRRD
jgi:zinc transporter